jgi:hypothetical protein
MRIFAAIIVVALATDGFAFGGRYSGAAWQTVQEHASHFNYELRYFLRKIGL